ncbi:MAG: cytochrome P450 [Myxococcota bacterium]
MATTAFLRSRPASDAPPRLRGGLPFVGHMAEWARNPFALLMRARREGGSVVQFQLLKQDMVLLTGPEANEAFFRAPDNQLCRREAYKLMTPIFGEGVVFDAPGDKLEQQLKMVMRFLRDKRMRSYPPTIEDETLSMVHEWGGRGELDLLEVMKEITLFASSRCLIGPEFRGGMDEEFRTLYEALEKAIHPLAYFQPNLPLPSFRRRDQARVRLVERVDAILERRRRTGDRPEDGLQALLEAAYRDGQNLSAHEITGILIAIMMAGHHTSAGTGTWVLLELARNREFLPRVRAELDAVWPHGETLTYGKLREMRFLHDVIKEVLRLHPPLIFLLRKVLREFRYGGYRIPAGAMVCATPAVSHRIAEVFPDPERFDPDRYARGEDAHRFAWIAFGGGKHKCTGNAFGLLQLKAIVAVLLRHYDFELTQPADSYVDNYHSATVMPRGPVRVRYRRRSEAEKSGTTTVAVRQRRADFQLDAAKPVTITIDQGLCQGHSVCVSEAPDVFRIGADGDAELLTTNPDAERYDALVRAYEHCPNRAIALSQN